MEMTREQADNSLELRDTILELFQDEKYKRVFEQAYFKDEAMRLTLAVVDNEMQDDIDQRMIQEKTRGIGHLHVFLNTAIQLGNQVQASLEAEERERELSATLAAKDMEVDEITGDTFEVTGD